MKKKVLMLALLVITMFTTVAMAQEDQSGAQKYIRYDGDVQKVFVSGKILIGQQTDKKDDRIYFGTKNAVVLDAKNGEIVDNYQFKKGDDVAVFIKENTPMTMSLPPQANADVVVINTKTFGKFVDVDHYEKNGEGLAKRTRFPNVLPDETKYVDYKERNAKKNMVLGRDLAVFYEKSTRSIPAMVIPTKVIIIEKPEVKTIELPKNVFEDNKKTQDGYALREVFNSLGFDVKYEAQTRRIKISKDNMLCYIALADNMAITNGEAFKVDFKAKNGVSYLTKDDIETMWQKMNKINIVDEDPDYLEK